jgi:hypothetical protein
MRGNNRTDLSVGVGHGREYVKVHVQRTKTEPPSQSNGYRLWFPYSEGQHNSARGRAGQERRSKRHASVCREADGMVRQVIRRRVFFEEGPGNFTFLPRGRHPP